MFFNNYNLIIYLKCSWEIGCKPETEKKRKRNKNIEKKKLRQLRNLKEIFRILDNVSSYRLHVSISRIELLAVQEALLADLRGHFFGNAVSDRLR